MAALQKGLWRSRKTLQWILIILIELSHSKIAGISWKKTTSVNPKADEALLLQKKDISSLLASRREEIEAGFERSRR